MKVSGTSFRNRDQRYVYEKPVRLHADRQTFDSVLAEGTVQDVSLSGVAVSISAAVENGQFVEMHIEGLGAVRGNVARVYEGGAAIQFEDDESRERAADTIRKMNQLA